MLSQSPKEVINTTKPAEYIRRRSTRVRAKPQFPKHDYSEDEAMQSSKRRKVMPKDKSKSASPNVKEIAPLFPNLDKNASKKAKPGALRMVNYSAGFMPGSTDSSTHSSRKSTPNEPISRTATTVVDDKVKEKKHLNRCSTPLNSSESLRSASHRSRQSNANANKNESIKSKPPANQSNFITVSTLKGTTSQTALVTSTSTTKSKPPAKQPNSLIADTSKGIKSESMAAITSTSTPITKDLLALEDSTRPGRPKPLRIASDSQRATRNSAPNALPVWADPKSPEFDLIRWLQSQEYHPPDPLLQKPPPNFTYADSSGRLKNPSKYAIAPPIQHAPLSDHPKIAYHRRNGTLTPELHTYYKDIPKDRVLPLAGIAPLDTRSSRTNSFTEVSPDLAEEAIGKLPTSVPMLPGLAKRREEMQVTNSIEQPTTTINSFLAPHWHNVGIQDDELTGLEQEENFYTKPTVRIPIPDHIKAILVDDWENVTKSQLLVPLPAEKPVETILDDYLASERPKRLEGTNGMDILEEVIAGLKEYFERCLGRILLYRSVRNVEPCEHQLTWLRFERNQYIEIREGWAKKTGDFAGKTAITTYGAEHFCRLLGMNFCNEP